MKAKSKHEKSMVVTVIVDAVTESTTQAHGGFVRKDLAAGRWYEVGDKIAREKVGHALRDAIKLREKLVKKQTERHRPESSARKSAKRRRTEMSKATKTNNTTEKGESTRPDFLVTSCSQVERAKASARNEKSEKQEKLEVVSSSKPSSPIGINEVPILPSEDDWEKSWRESSEQFTKLTSVENKLSLSDVEGSDSECSDDECFNSGDSVLNSMALETSSKDKGTTEDAEEAYQASLREMQLAEEQMVETTGEKFDSTEAQENKFVFKPPGDNKMEDEFDAYMKNFGPTPMKSSADKAVEVSKPNFQWKPPSGTKMEANFKNFGPTPMKKPAPAASKPKFQWKPPGDSGTDSMFEAFMRSSRRNESAQSALNPMKSSVSNQNRMPAADPLKGS
jgi:hypothetical protein